MALQLWTHLNPYLFLGLVICAALYQLWKIDREKSSNKISTPGYWFWFTHSIILIVVAMVFIGMICVVQITTQK